MSVGDRVKKLRETKGWSQTQLAKEVNKRGGKLSQQNVANIESGIVKQPKALLSLAEALEVLPHWLETGKGSKTRDDLILAFGGPGAAAAVLQKRRGQRDAAAPEPALAVSSIVAAGDEIIGHDEGDPIDYEPAPPGLYDGEVTEVRGRSMLPIFRDGDRLFHKVITEDPMSVVGEAAVLKLKDGRRFIKVLQPGTRRGRFRLLSLNPAYEPMEDQVVVSAARIVWVKKSQQ